MRVIAALEKAFTAKKTSMYLGLSNCISGSTSKSENIKMLKSNRGKAIKIYRKYFSFEGKNAEDATISGKK
jgi:hypothetical protein